MSGLIAENPSGFALTRDLDFINQQNPFCLDAAPAWLPACGGTMTQFGSTRDVRGSIAD